jgi:hypothetical protein
MYCAECGHEMTIGDDGVSTHLMNGKVDHELNSDHVAIDEEVLVEQSKLGNTHQHECY